MSLLMPVAPKGLLSPADINGVQGWWEADAITGLADGATITTWSDQSGNSANLTQATVGPVYKTGIINGLPVARFSHATSATMKCPDPGFAGYINSDTMNLTWGLVINPNSFASTGPLFCTASGLSDAGVNLNLHTTGILRVVNGPNTNIGPSSTTALVVGTTYVVVVTYIDATYAFYINALTADASGIHGMHPVGQATRRISGQASTYFDADIASLFIASRVLAAEEIAFLLHYWGNKYAVTIGG